MPSPSELQRQHEDRRLVYLASPYSHDDPIRRGRRLDAACRCAAALIKRGVLVYCPIAHTAYMAELLGLDFTWETWKELDKAFLERCHEFWILTIEGWQESVGIKAELAIAIHMQMPVRYVNKLGEVSNDA